MNRGNTSMAKRNLLWGYAYYGLLSMAASFQITTALTVSLLQVRHLEPGIQLDKTLYLVGFLVIMFFLLSLNILTRKPVFVTVVCLLFWNLIALVNFYEILFHGTVLTHQDIGNISTAMEQVGNYTFQFTREVCFIVITFAVFVVVLLLIGVYTKKKAPRLGRLQGFIPLLISVGMSWLIVFSPVAIVKKGDWSWELKYFTDSFIVGTMENFRRAINPVQKPDGYNEVDIQGAAGLKGTGTEYPDIIMILNETYYDMDHLIDYDTDVSFMANYDALDAYKGYAAVPIVGGGYKCK